MKRGSKLHGRKNGCKVICAAVLAGTLLFAPAASAAQQHETAAAQKQVLLAEENGQQTSWRVQEGELWEQLWAEVVAVNGDAARTEYEHDENGQMIEARAYYANDSLAYSLVCEYDDDGNLARADAVAYGDNQKPVLHYFVTGVYDDAGQLESSMMYSDGEIPVAETTYKYKSNGELAKTEMTIYSDEGKLESFASSEYADGEVVKITTKTAAGVLDAITEYEYDDSGNRREGRQTSYDKAGKETVSRAIKWDASGNTTGSSICYYEYDDGGNATGYLFLFYNAEGKPIAGGRYNAEGELQEQLSESQLRLYA